MGGGGELVAEYLSINHRAEKSRSRKVEPFTGGAMLWLRIRLITLMRIRVLIFIWCDPDVDPDPTFHPDADLGPSFQ